MRVAFYAPLKPPDHPVPSGDRRVARLFMDALRAGGNTAELASDFRSYDGVGDPAVQAALRAQGRELAKALIAECQTGPVDARPELWFTYHLYHKAPDWLGPAVASTLQIPYVVAEASHAPKQADGAWDIGYQAAAKAIAVADLVLSPTRLDMECLEGLVAPSHRLEWFPPFLDAAPYAAPDPARSRAEWAARLNLDPARPWLLCVAMMRPGDKALSYRQLADALTRLLDVDWHLVVVGDGPAAADIRRDLENRLPGRCGFAGALDQHELPPAYRACDLYVWPAVREAFGMAFLEAQAAGLPVVAGATGGVADVVLDGETGVLVAPDDAVAFADAVHDLLVDSKRRADMAVRASRFVSEGRDLAAAARRLNTLLAEISK